uniref:Large ribosomal subunit protein eL28 n=1 Tax=Romanomermis culicivorax TaxID=13658 RepID=A0A915IB92_ROMCU
MVAASSEIQWACIRKSSCFLRKQRGVNKTFTREPMNLTGINSFVFNGLIHKDGIAVETNSENKGVTLSLKKTKCHSKPAKSLTRINLRKGGRKTCKTIKNVVKMSNVRPALSAVAQRRACQILRSQKPPRPQTLTKSKRQKKEKSK